MFIEIPNKLLEKAYLTEDKKEAAWARGDALQVIEWCAETGVPILGVDVWLPTIPGPTIPTPYIYTFESRQMPSESKTDFAIRSANECGDYVKSFEWDAEESTHHSFDPFFNLTFGEST